MKPGAKKILFTSSAGILVIFLILVSSEILIFLIKPQATLFPRYSFDRKYGHLLYPNTVMIHSKPRSFYFEYHINEQKQRGPYIRPQDAVNPVLVLGDSYSFGLGVNEGEEYPAVLNALLQGKSTVINLGVPGWGLTQEIRRYYELGKNYQARFVILQFCRNDVDDGTKNPVASWDGAQFVFHDAEDTVYSFLKSLSRSPIQKSQLYNFIRDNASFSIHKQRVASHSKGETEDQLAYVNLLSAFAKKLKSGGVSLILISVHGDLERFEIVHESVKQLQTEGFLTYEDTQTWLNGQQDLLSPEGHRWNAKAHRIIAEKLAGVLTKNQQ